MYRKLLVSLFLSNEGVMSFVFDSTTQKYVGVNYATAREAVEAIALEAKASSSELTEIFCPLQPYEMEILSSS